MLEALQNFFYSGYFMPHGSCYLWKPGLVGLHLVSDVLIAFSYYSIPVMLFYFVSKREDLPFDWIFLLFAAFIIACGTNHLFEVWTLWHPSYWLSGFGKLTTGLISAYTAIQLFSLIPKALTLPSPAQLEAEINERKQVEQELREYKDKLEELVEKRTTQLATANAQLQQEISEKELSRKKLVVALTEVESINQELNSFAYVVSHDLKAPLRGIKNLADWLVSDYGETLNEEGKNLLDLLMSRVQKMHDLIDGILQYSRVGRIQENKKEIDLNLLVENTIDLVYIPSNITIEMTTELPVVVGEPTRFQQLFQNLFSNAIKFIDKPEGKITVGCEDKGENWHFSIADNGPGIGEEYRTRIFQIFQKLSPDDSGSTGIGLALVKKIVEMYGGKVWVESVIGEGSTFCFTLPKVIDSSVEVVFDTTEVT